jgi:hypothetical protein
VTAIDNIAIRGRDGRIRVLTIECPDCHRTVLAVVRPGFHAVIARGGRLWNCVNREVSREEYRRGC